MIRAALILAAGVSIFALTACGAVDFFVNLFVGVEETVDSTKAAVETIEDTSHEILDLIEYLKIFFVATAAIFFWKGASIAVRKAFQQVKKSW